MDRELNADERAYIDKLNDKLQKPHTPPSTLRFLYDDQLEHNCATVTFLNQYGITQEFYLLFSMGNSFTLDEHGTFRSYSKRRELNYTRRNFVSMRTCYAY